MGQNSSDSNGVEKAATAPCEPESHFATLAPFTPIFSGFASQQELERRIIGDAAAAKIADALPELCYSDSTSTSRSWYLLYNSHVHGKSFMQMVDRICEKGPTVLVIKIKGTSQLIGAYCGTSWLGVSAREKVATSVAATLRRAERLGQSTAGIKTKPENQNNLFFGDDSCFVFTAGGEEAEKDSNSSNCTIYRAHSFTNSNYMYLFDTHPDEEKEGIGMGGQPGYFGWFLDKWLEHGYCYGNSCTTFKCPRLSCVEKWEVDCIEVYAVKATIVEKLMQTGAGMTARDSCLRGNADTNADRLLLELHGVHKFDQNERPEV